MNAFGWDAAGPTLRMLQQPTPVAPAALFHVEDRAVMVTIHRLIRFRVTHRQSPAIMLLLSALAVAGSVSADVAPPAADPILELPKYTVTGKMELPPPEAWRYAEFPGFTVLSNAPDRKTQRLLANFEWFRYALSIVWPMPDKTSVPVSIIVCGADDTFAAFVPEAKRGEANQRLSYLLHDREQAAIIIDAETTVFSGGGPAEELDGELAGGNAAVESADLLCREYVRFLFSRSAQNLPVWMEEGLIQMFLAMNISQEQVAFGQIEDPSAGSSGEIPGLPGSGGGPREDGDFNRSFGRLMPLDKFFAVTRGSAWAHQLYGNNRWVKQAYAFVHMCVLGRGGRYRKPFVQFLQRASREPVTEAMFKECFGMNYKEMQVELSIYKDFTDHQSMEYFLKKGSELPKPTPLVLRDAEEFESARLKGDALLLGGHFREARAVLLPAYLRGSRDPGLLATLGLCERAAGENDRARKFLEAAVAHKVVRPEAYLELARMRHAEAIAKPAAGKLLSTEQVAGITSLLHVARHQPPHMPELYELLADTWQRSAAKPTRDDVLILIQGATLFPDHLAYVAQTAAFAVDAGIFDAARPMIEHGLDRAKDPQIAARFAQLKASLPATGAKTAAPAAE